MRFEGLVIVVCGGCASGAGTAAGDLARQAGAACPGAAVRVLEHPCARPSELQAALQALEGDALVLLACGDPEATEALRRAAAGAGFDPHGVACADSRRLGGEGPVSRGGRTRSRLRALGRRALAYPGVHPDQVVLRLPGLGAAVSRRGLLGLLRPQYRLVPRVDAGRCAASLGCRFCRGACPCRAVGFDGGVAEVVAVRCSGCGACVPACRFEALRFPGWTAEELAAELSGLLDAGAVPAVMFACEPALREMADAGEPPGWETVALPCLERLDARLLLQAAFAGCDVAVRACPGACPHGCRLVGVRRAVAFARRVLAAAGHPRTVRWFPGEAREAPLPADVSAPPRETSPSGADRDGATPRSLAGLVAELVSTAPRGVAPIEGGAVPFGIVSADHRCTLCGVCASRCPTGALRLAASGGGTALEFEHRRCVACGFCVRDCPERALRLRRAADPAALASGPRALARAFVARCGDCGAELAPDPLRDRAGAGAALCPRCRIGRQLRALPRGKTVGATGAPPLPARRTFAENRD